VVCSVRRNESGFSLVEMTVVLVLIGIIAAYVIGRSIGTEQIELAGLTDKIRNQIRYAQATAAAMKAVSTSRISYSEFK